MPTTTLKFLRDGQRFAVEAAEAHDEIADAFSVKGQKDGLLRIAGI